MSRPIHVGQPPSECGRASPTSAWHPDTGTCEHCLGTWSARPPHRRAKPEDEHAKAISDYRISMGLTQHALADSLGVSRATLNRWEKRTSPANRALLDLGRKLEAVQASTERAPQATPGPLPTLGDGSETATAPEGAGGTG